ncbi:MAG: 23S rRNA (uracil(1939)-C(5))-methyltransferase RlmD [Verrucomicrobia bacterium]|nr:23S rRNA (uracil(1939)-C(5))-methyltransferase RlmD [Verrucomicrobiota bacterium]
MIKGSIESIAFGGEGILRHDGLVIFVPFTAPGDVAEVELVAKKKNFAHAKLVTLDKKSPSRTDPPCFYFGSCGGCQLQHLNYSAQIDAKRTFVLDALKRIGKIDIEDLTVTPTEQQWHYRRHIRLSLRKAGEGFKAGYVGCDPSQFINVAKCPIFLPSEDALLGTLEPFLSSLSNEGIEEGSLRLIKANEGKFILAFNFSPMLPKNHSLAKEALEKNSSWQGIAMQSPHAEKAWGNIECQTQTLGLKAHFSPFGFVQNHPEQSENLYRAILNALPDAAKIILDLYCGIGITSLLFAKQEKLVVGVETHAETIQLAKENAALNKIESVQFQQGKAESLGVELLIKERPDAVLCNPPRTGLDPVLLDALCSEKPACILYVSCMPSTLARDLQKLIQAGYKIDLIQAFDMFPQTTHVETLVKLTIT